MYCCIKTFDNSNLPGEKLVNPRNMAIQPKDIARLTSEGRATAVQQLDGCLYYPGVADGVMPFEFQRGIDENDCWEESNRASRKVAEYVKHKQQKDSMVEEHS